jgi:hypothetical protein
MATIDFWVTSLKVKATGALNVKMVSTHYLGNFYNKVFIFNILIGHMLKRAPLIFGSLVQRSRHRGL